MKKVVLSLLMITSLNGCSVVGGVIEATGTVISTTGDIISYNRNLPPEMYNETNGNMLAKNSIQPTPEQQKALDEMFDI